MRSLLDAFWRAAAYCLHPRVIALSMLPLLLMAALALGAGYLFWEPAVDAVRSQIDAWQLLGTLFAWLASVGLPNLKSVLAPLLVVFLATPVIVVLTLLVVAFLMTPSMLSLVADRRFPQLERKRGGSLLGAVAGSVWATVVALVALVVSMPFWFVPPLVLVLPPLIWGWMTYKVMSYDVLAEHASVDERRALLREHRPMLLAIGIISGYLGAAPSIVWASGAMFIALAPLLIAVAVWIYTLVFAFSSLWFAHYTLAALERLRAANRPADLPAASPHPPPADLALGSSAPSAFGTTRAPDALPPP